MASISWDSQAVIMIDYLEQSRTINGAYNAGELRRQPQKIAIMRQGKLTPGGSALLGQRTAHTSQVAMFASTECDLKSFTYPPYFPDMTPSDFTEIPSS